MKKFILYLPLLLLAACTSLDENPYGDSLRHLKVTVVYPDGHDDNLREGVTVRLDDRNSSNRYTSLTDKEGCAEFTVTAGHYNVSVTDKPDKQSVFQGRIEQLDLMSQNREVSVDLHYSKPGTIVIKEVYTGGCAQDAPSTGTYVYDKYLILHNNSDETLYLDGLCLSMVAPYNSKVQNNPWTSVDGDGNIVFRDYAAAPDCIWQFGGSGSDHPLSPGEDAVVAMNGAVDHTKTYSHSVNLNQEGFYVLYDQVNYPDPRSHPVPGDRIEEKNYLKVLKKTGRVGTNVYVISNYSPAVIIFRFPEDFDAEGYLADDKQSAVQNGSIIYSKVDWQWIVDAVEVSDNTGASNFKRLRTDIDAGSCGFSGTSKGHTVHRRVDEEASAVAGYEVLLDTNNSTDDFYERETQSLHK